jgi:predicted peptidase
MDLDRRALLAGSLWLSACASPDDLLLRAGQQAHSLAIEGVDGRRSVQRFWLALPANYHEHGKTWPLVFFLHGSGERGSELDLVKRHGPPKLVDQGQRFPFILVSPQLDADRRWDPHQLQALSQHLQLRLRVDARRVMATGLSLGGHGCWDWACAYPASLAAIAPVCGFGTPAQACAMRDVPVRAYHGDADTVVPLARQQEMIAALRACGGSAELTIYPGVGHNAWDPAYADPQLYAWLLAQRRS